MNHPTRTRSPSLTQYASFDPITLFPQGSAFGVLGTVQNWTLDQSGRIRCSLALSIGDLRVRANRDTLPLNIGNGTWVRANLMRPYDDGPEMQVLSALPTTPAPGTTSWVPMSLHHRIAGMRELRGLLATLEPALQGLFMSAMVGIPAQRHFYWRPAAADHHCYPGGLFDHSVAAAKAAHQGAYADDRDRGLATLASLLFDIGKIDDAWLQRDRTRRWPELPPHPMTQPRLEHPLACLARLQPVLAGELNELLAVDRTRTGRGPRMTALRVRVREAVRQAWEPGLDTLTTKPGAAA